METTSLPTQELGNGVKVVVRSVDGGFRCDVHAPDVYGSAVNPRIMGSPVLGRKLPWKTEGAALKAGIKFANENFAHIIDPDTYWS